MTQTDGGVAECDGCGQPLSGTLKDGVLIHRANYDLGRIEILHLCLDGVDDAVGCAVYIQELTTYYNHKEDNKPKRKRPFQVEEGAKVTKKKAAKKPAAKKPAKKTARKK